MVSGAVLVYPQANSVDPGKDKAPAFTLENIEGEEVSLSDFEGKIVILDFWTTWCQPCRAGIPDLIEIQKEYHEKVAVIGISLDRLTGTESDLAPFIEEYGINYPVVFGTEQIIGDYGNIQSIPTSFVLDKNGNVVDSNIGLVPKSKFVNIIRKLLKET